MTSFAQIIVAARPNDFRVMLLIRSFILAISIALLQVLYYSDALPTTALILYRSFTPKRTGNCRKSTCPRSLRRGWSRSRTQVPPVESLRLKQGATTFHSF